ncbi:MAG: hypothetical protein HY746_00975 [Elusimicrobia bacterium]|nr:hypothetical protein [Elusimicrobiota bacterium]
MKNKIIMHETILNSKKFKVIINLEHNTASANFVTNETIISSEIDDYIVLHYGEQTKTLVGFTILHLQEFFEYIEAKFKKYVEEKRLKEQEWLKRKAEESIYKVISEKKYRSVFQIPEPLWHMSSHRSR